MGMIYFDNAATSWPKPPQVLDAMRDAVMDYGANPGRGSHAMAVKASKVIFEARHHLARLIGVGNPNHISFALNTTMALNQAIKGFVRTGDHVICTNIEHNSVRRPLEYLRQHKQVEITYIECNETGQLDLQQLRQAFQSNTKLVVCNHSSNLLGNILPIEEIAELTAQRNAKLLVDAAQTIGLLPIDVGRMGIDMLAFPGHKGLLGPQGTGGLYVDPSIELEPLLHGGTGSQSEAIGQPTVRPDRYESGTQNTPGIAGLNEGVKFILNETVEKIHHKEWTLTCRLIDGLKAIQGIQLLGPGSEQPRTGVVSFVFDQLGASEAAFILDRHYRIAVRSGYHCTPLAHEAAGTLDTGAVRASLGYFTTEDEVDAFIQAVKEMASTSF